MSTRFVSYNWNYKKKKGLIGIIMSLQLGSEHMDKEEYITSPKSPWDFKIALIINEKNVSAPTSFLLKNLVSFLPTNALL